MTLAVAGFSTVAWGLYDGIIERQKSQEAQIQIAVQKSVAAEVQGVEINRRLDRMEDKLDDLISSVKHHD